MNYPNKISKTKVKNTNYANRGMFLEEDLNLSNKYYLESNIAIIHKKPTPIKIVKVSFDSKKNATINEAYFKMPSTTDYNGIYKGKYIDFEAKEVKNNKCFPLSNINNHQIICWFYHSIRHIIYVGNKIIATTVFSDESSQFCVFNGSFLFN